MARSGLLAAPCVAGTLTLAAPATAETTPRIAMTGSERPPRPLRQGDDLDLGIRPDAALPMSEFLQENLKSACRANFAFNLMEWQVLLNTGRAMPDAPSLGGSLGLAIRSPSSDAGEMALKAPI